MNIRIKSMADCLSGVLFVCLGVIIMWAAGNYPIGSAASMGPGYFPRMLGGLLALLGIIITAQSFHRAQTPPSETTEPYPHHGAFPLRAVIMAALGCGAFWVMMGWFGKTGWTGLDVPVLAMLVISWFASRELFWVLLAIAGFAVTLMHLGLVIATAVLLILAHFASDESRWRETIINFFVLLAICLATFVYGLKLQFPVLPEAVSAYLRTL